MWSGPLCTISGGRFRVTVVARASYVGYSCQAMSDCTHPHIFYDEPADQYECLICDVVLEVTAKVRVDRHDVITTATSTYSNKES